MNTKLSEWFERYPTFTIRPEYIAGFTDGDGSIYMQELKKKDGTNGGFQLMSSFAQSYPFFCILLQSVLRGSIYSCKREKSNYRYEFQLRLTGKDNLRFFEIMKNHAIIKDKQAILGEEFLNNYYNKIANNIDNVRVIHSKIRDLNTSLVIPEQNFQRINWIYIAGLFDAEGCIICNVSDKKRYNLYLTQKNHMDLLDKIREYIGYGKVMSSDYRIVISTMPNIIHFLEQVIPYLIVKRKQAESMLTYVTRRHNMSKSHPDYCVITEEDKKLFEIIHNEKHQNSDYDELYHIIKSTNIRVSNNKTKIYESFFEPKPENCTPDRSTKNKVSKRVTNFHESSELIRSASYQKNFKDILNDWNQTHEKKINERQLLNLWNGKTELLPFEFTEQTSWTYQEYCNFMKNLPSLRNNIECAL